MAVFASLFLTVSTVSAGDDVYVGGDLAYGSTPEGGAHAMIGLRNLRDEPNLLELSSGLTTSRIVLPDGRIYWSAQPVWLPVGALAGGAIGVILVIPHEGPEPIAVGMAVGWITAQILTNSEMRIGTKNISAIGAQQLDWLVPGWHPREKLSAGIQLGNSIAFRVMGTRSFSAIEDLNQFGVEFRLVANYYGS
ncbi:MAG: hypothetical protein IPK50_11395 [Fibrobacterota bacterium]|nr:hypothetical protein [Fibrobacterota bacterium]QQS07478.1 MAG: hypothetical protein IPK50_11395 [Fibrobacterota bacterium]